jgi:hypothetical protein
MLTRHQAESFSFRAEQSHRTNQNGNVAQSIRRGAVFAEVCWIGSAAWVGGAVLRRIVQSTPPVRTDIFRFHSLFFVSLIERMTTQWPKRCTDRHTPCSRTIGSLIKIKDRTGLPFYERNWRQPRWPAWPKRVAYSGAAQTAKEFKTCRHRSPWRPTNFRPDRQSPCTDNGVYFWQKE